MIRITNGVPFWHTGLRELDLIKKSGFPQTFGLK